MSSIYAPYMYVSSEIFTTPKESYICLWNRLTARVLPLLSEMPALAVLLTVLAHQARDNGPTLGEFLWQFFGIGGGILFSIWYVIILGSGKPSNVIGQPRSCL